MICRSSLLEQCWSRARCNGGPLLWEREAAVSPDLVETLLSRSQSAVLLWREHAYMIRAIPNTSTPLTCLHKNQTRLRFGEKLRLQALARISRCLCRARQCGFLLKGLGSSTGSRIFLLCLPQAYQTYRSITRRWSVRVRITYSAVWFTSRELGRMRGGQTATMGALPWARGPPRGGMGGGGGGGSLSSGSRVECECGSICRGGFAGECGGGGSSKWGSELGGLCCGICEWAS